MIPENQIPEFLQFRDIKINPRKRLNDYIKGRGKPVNGFYIRDIIEWLKWEGNLPLLKNFKNS